MALAFAVACTIGLLAPPLSPVIGLPLIRPMGDFTTPLTMAVEAINSLALPAVAQFLISTRKLPGTFIFRASAAAAAFIPAVLLGIVEVAVLPALALLAPAFLGTSGPALPSRKSSTGPLSVDMLHDAIFEIDAEGNIKASNSATKRLLGHDGVGRHITRFIPALKESEFADLSAVSPMQMDTQIRRESSEQLAVEITLSGQGEGGNWRGMIRMSDITARLEQTAKLERLALHDALTGLPNRVLLHDRINQSLAIAERRKEPMAVLLMDLDKFKQVNDNLGHHVGDLLLQAVGPRLAGPLRKTDTLCRLGGDEFAVLLPPSTSVETARSVASRLVEEILDPFMIEGMALELGVSIGVAVYPQHGTDLETLMQNSDAAMYKAKRGKLGYCVFDSEQDYQNTQKAALQKQLKIAIDNNDLNVLYHPKVLGGTMKVCGVEALVRWEHPQLGILQPSEFIPLAEQTGLIMPLTLAVLNKCLDAQRQWRHAGLDMPLAVNVSGKWLQDKTFPKILRLLLSNWHGRPDRLVLEIPEAAIMTDPDGTLEVMNGLHDQGIALSLDDFGTGYSSLPMLQRLPIDEVKIDRGFIDGMVNDKGSAVVVRSVVKLAHGLGLRVVAEGVENKITADWLSGLGCDQLQGFYFSKPLEAENVAEWVEENSREVESRLTATGA